MHRMVLAAVLGVAALTVSAPAASASHEIVSCRWSSSVRSGDSHLAVVSGMAIAPGEAISWRCVVRVGSRIYEPWYVVSTPSVKAGVVTYTRYDNESATLCTQWTTSHGSGETCYGTTELQIPPQEVIDAVDEVVCLVREILNDECGPSSIRPGSGGAGGDAYVDGQM